MRPSPRFVLSLRARLLWGLMLPLAAAALLNLWFAHHEAQQQAARVQDRLLLGSARIIAQQIHEEDGVLDVAIPPAALELFQSTDQDRVYYRVASASGQLLSGYAELVGPPGVVHAEESTFFTAEVRGAPVRVVAYGQPIFGASQDGPVVIEVAQTYEAHRQLVRQLWLTSLRQEAWTLALVALLAWVALRHGLKDILRLRDKVGKRTPGSLEPLEVGSVPHELVPLVDAINGYVHRLDAQMALRSRFIANASHQLRTPFTILQTQTNFGLRSASPEQKDEALRAIFRGVRDGTRLVNQLLSLSSAEAGVMHPRPLVPVNLVELAQRVLEEQAGLAQAKDIDLGLDAPVEPVSLPGSSAMLHELVANLVDNALRYSPPGGVVTVVVRQEPDHVVLRVEDSGPGIPEADRNRVFERFCRLHDDDTPGCGLGLSIVQEVATVLGAEISLSDPPAGTGLVVTLRFPLRQEEP